MVRINPLKLQSSTGILIWDGILIQSRSTPSSLVMAGRLLFPTFNTHLVNFHCSLELVATTRMFIWRRKIVTCYQRCDRGKEALTMSSHPPLGTTGKICRKSLPKPQFSQQRFSWLPMSHPIASNQARCDEQLRKFGDASSVLHPKWLDQFYAPTRPLSSIVWCCKLTHRPNQSEFWILNGRFCRPEVTKTQFLMKQLQARFCLALVNGIEVLSKQMFYRFHHCHTQRIICPLCLSRHSK